MVYMTTVPRLHFVYIFILKLAISKSKIVSVEIDYSCGRNVRK